jgi:GxxExxY protein
MEKAMSELIYGKEAYEIVGACFEVYNEKGNGFLEPVYHDCVELELGFRQIPFIHEPPLNLSYKGHPLKHGYSPDFSCWDKIILELKAVEKLTDEHVAQPQCNRLRTRIARELRAPPGTRMEAHRSFSASVIRGHSRKFAGNSSVSS